MNKEFLAEKKNNYSIFFAKNGLAVGDRDGSYLPFMGEFLKDHGLDGCKHF